MRRFGTVLGVVLAALLIIGTVGLRAQQANYTDSIRIKNGDEATFADLAKISLDSAMNAALKQVPGKVLRIELENENGYLVYGIEIVKTDHQIVDVKVDAGNGKILKTDYDHEDKEDHKREDSDSGHEEEEREG